MIDWEEVRASNGVNSGLQVVGVTDDNVEELRAVFGPGLSVGEVILRNGRMCRRTTMEQLGSFGLAPKEDPLCPKEWWGLGYRPLSRGEMPPFGTVVHLRGRDRRGEPIEGLGGMLDVAVEMLTGRCAGDILVLGANTFYAMEEVSPASWEKGKEEK